MTQLSKDDKFISMVRSAFDYIFSVFPRNGWTIETNSRREFVASNGDLAVCVMGEWDGCFIHALDHSRQGNSFSFFKMYVYHHEPDCDWKKEREEEHRLSEIARKEILNFIGEKNE